MINYIPKDELEQFFKDASKVLNNEGYFLFDVNSLYGFEEVAQGSLSIDLEDKFISIDASFEALKLNTDITLFTKTKNDLYKKEHDRVTQYYHDIKTLKAYLKKASFEIEDIINFNLHTQNEAGEEADKLIFICKKLLKN